MAAAQWGRRRQKREKKREREKHTHVCVFALKSSRPYHHKVHKKTKKSTVYALFAIERLISTKLSSILVPAFVLFVLFACNSSSSTSHWSTIAETTSGATFFSWNDDKNCAQCIAMSCSSAARTSECKFVRSLAVPAFKE